MNSPKEATAEILKELPDDSTYDDIMYRIYVRRKVERGLKDVEEGRIVSQKEAERRTAKWRLK
jgi:predicted transcriptional regulator